MESRLLLVGAAVLSGVTASALQLPHPGVGRRAGKGLQQTSRLFASSNSVVLQSYKAKLQDDSASSIRVTFDTSPGDWDSAPGYFLQPNPKLQQGQPNAARPQTVVMFARAAAHARDDVGSRADSGAGVGSRGNSEDDVGSRMESRGDTQSRTDSGEDTRSRGNSENDVGSRTETRGDKQSHTEFRDRVGTRGGSRGYVGSRMDSRDDVSPRMDSTGDVRTRTASGDDVGTHTDSRGDVRARTESRDDAGSRAGSSPAAGEARLGLYFRRELQRVVGAGMARLAGGAGASLRHLQVLAGLKGRSRNPQGSGFYFAQDIPREIRLRLPAVA